jgi:small-conductance mechanosensitive channel
VAVIRNRGNLRAILAGASFRRLLGVRLVSQFADALFQGGLAGSVLFNPTEQTSPTAIATGFAVLLLPYSLIGPYVGVVLDRWSRRTVIYLCNLVRASLVLPAAWYIWHGGQSAGYVASALLIIGINRLLLSGLSASQPHVVPERLLVTANALATTLGTLVYSLGLGAAVLLLNSVLHKEDHGYATLASFATIGYLTSALLCRHSFTARQLGPLHEEGQPREPLLVAMVEVAKGMVAGVVHLAHRRGPAYGILAQSAHRMLYGVLTLTTLLLFRRYFYPDSAGDALAGLGEVVVAGGLGALLAALVTPGVTRRIGGRRWITALLALVGVNVAAFGLPFKPLLLVAATFVINLASQGMKIVVDTSIQRECADDYRGRVFSVNDTLFNVCFVAGLFIAARTLPADGHSWTALVSVVAGYVVLATWYGVAAGRLGGRPAVAEDDVATSAPTPLSR